MKKINVITLGCSKNTVDSEHLMARLAAAGYEVLFDSDRTDAKVVVINTCGFIGDAKQESIDMILQAQTLRLPENLRGLQLEMRLLRHSAHPRRTRLRPDGETRR